LADGFQRPPVHPGWRSHALTVLDDHSRFNVCLKALPNQRGESVKQALSATFRLYGLHAHGQWSALGRRAWKFQPLVIRWVCARFQKVCLPSSMSREPMCAKCKTREKSRLGENRQSRPSFPGCPVGIKATLIDGLFDIVFCRQRIGQINLRALGWRLWEFLTKIHQTAFTFKKLLPMSSARLLLLSPVRTKGGEGGFLYLLFVDMANQNDWSFE